MQNFPTGYNYNNEVDRFRYAGHLWREANPERLTKVLEGDGEGERRVGPDAGHLRGVARPAAGADAAVVRRVSASDAGGVFPPEPRESRVVLHRVVLDR